jgi:hypothetical protein
MTFYYYLTSLSDARWALYSSHEARPTVFADKLAAMLEAKNRCREHWARTGIPCGVRIQAPHGKWDEHYLAGDMADAPAEAQDSVVPGSEGSLADAAMSNP